MTDAETLCLTRELARCDEAAWRDFHGRYFGFLQARAIARGVPESEAPEVVQRVYLRVIRHAKTFAHTADFEAWLCCLTRCESIDSGRRLRRRSWLSEKFQAWSLQREESAAAPESRRPHDRLEAALETLAGSDRTLLTRHYLGGWSQEDLAREQGTSTKAVESRLARLRTRLRAILENPETC